MNIVALCLDAPFKRAGLGALNDTRGVSHGEDLEVVFEPEEAEDEHGGRRANRN